MSADRKWMIDDSYGDSVHLPDFCCAEDETKCHPVVVIDPEDRDQQDGLRDLIRNHGGGMIPGEVLQAALRALADPTPPRPKEPQGLGAVVEDADGALWTRVGGSRYPWHTGTASTGDPFRVTAAYNAWKHIAAVRVLSEGVTL